MLRLALPRVTMPRRRSGFRRRRGPCRRPVAPPPHRNQLYPEDPVAQAPVTPPAHPIHPGAGEFRPPMASVFHFPAGPWRTALPSPLPRRRRVDRSGARDPAATGLLHPCPAFQQRPGELKNVICSCISARGVFVRKNGVFIPEEPVRPHDGLTGLNPFSIVKNCAARMEIGQIRRVFRFLELRLCQHGNGAPPHDKNGRRGAYGGHVQENRYV